MPMKNPAHPGRIVQLALTSLGLSVTEAARGLGVSRPHLSKLLNGHAGISPEMAIRLEKGIGSTADHWLRLQNAYDLAHTKRTPKSETLDDLALHMEQRRLERDVVEAARRWWMYGEWSKEHDDAKLALDRAVEALEGDAGAEAAKALEALEGASGHPRLNWCPHCRSYGEGLCRCYDDDEEELEEVEK